MDFVEVDVGRDRFRAQVISDMLASEGIENTLRLSSDPYVGLDHVSPHVVLVAEHHRHLVSELVTAFES